MASSKPTVTVSLPILAKMIDHSLLHPTMTDQDLTDGLRLALRHQVVTACIKPYAIPLARQHLHGTAVGICAVIGFPHGNSSMAVKVFEAEEACAAIGAADLGRAEIDMVINVGKARGGDWEYVTQEIRAVNEAVRRHGAIVKVIFENDYLSEPEIARLCRICTALGVAFVKTSTGYGFVKRPDGNYNYRGATQRHLRLMRAESGPDVQVKAAGGVRTLDDLIVAMSLGVTRIGATATEAMLDEARRRGIGETEVEVPVPVVEESGDGAY